MVFLSSGTLYTDQIMKDSSSEDAHERTQVVGKTWKKLSTTDKTRQLSRCVCMCV